MKRLFPILLFGILLSFSAPAWAANTVHSSAEYGFRFETTDDYDRLYLEEKAITPEDGMFYAEYKLSSNKKNILPLYIKICHGNLYPDKSITTEGLLTDPKVQKKYLGIFKKNGVKASIAGIKETLGGRFLITKMSHKQAEMLEYAAAKEDEAFVIFYRSPKPLTDEQKKLLLDNIDIIATTFTWPDKLAGQTEVAQDMAKGRIDYQLPKLGFAFSAKQDFSALVTPPKWVPTSSLCFITDNKRQYPMVEIGDLPLPKDQQDLSYSKNTAAFEKELSRADSLVNIKYSRLFARKAVITENYRFLVTVLELNGQKNFSAYTIENGKKYAIHTKVPMNQPDKHKLVEENFYLILDTFTLLN